MIAFVILFAGLTIVALFSAAPTIGSVISFGLAFAVLALIVIGVIGAIRNPPDE